MNANKMNNKTTAATVTEKTAKKTTISYVAEHLTAKGIDHAVLTYGREIAIKGKNGKRLFDIYNRTNAIRICTTPEIIAKLPAALVAAHPDGTLKRDNNASGNLKGNAYVDAKNAIKAVDKLMSYMRTVAEKDAAEKDAAAAEKPAAKGKGGKGKPAAKDNKGKGGKTANKGKGKPAKGKDKPAEKPAAEKVDKPAAEKVTPPAVDNKPAADGEKVNAAK